MSTPQYHEQEETVDDLDSADSYVRVYVSMYVHM